MRTVLVLLVALCLVATGVHAQYGQQQQQRGPQQWQPNVGNNNQNNNQGFQPQQQQQQQHGQQPNAPNRFAQPGAPTPENLPFHLQQQQQQQRQRAMLSPQRQQPPQQPPQFAQQQQQQMTPRKPPSSLVGALLPNSPLLPPLPFSHVDANHDNVIDQREFATYTSGTIPGAPIVRAEELIQITNKKKGTTTSGSAPIFSFEEQPMYMFGAAFLNSVAMIIVTELGDKTFFIAAILAMQHPRMIIFIGAIGALAAMTVLSAAIGFALPNLLPRMYTHYAASLLFLYFGLRLLKDARDMDTTQPNEELEEVEQELGMDSKKGDVEAGSPIALSPAKLTILTQAFTLTFLAEWGDRSQIATIALASAKDPFGVTLGGIIGHAMCTGLAVVGGRLLATKISERTVAIAGGILFLIFAAHSWWAGPDV